MNPRTILLVLVALSLAGGTALFARNWVQSQRPAVAAKPAPVIEGKEVLVARQNLPAGTFVKPDHMRWQPWPDQNIAQAYIVKGKGDMNALVGAVVRQGIAVGEPITEGRIVKPGDRGFLAAVLDPGMRAITVAVNAETGIAGLVFPGDRVDLIVTHSIRVAGAGRNARRAGETVLTKIRVLAMDQKTDDQSGKPAVSKTVTLEVTPKQAEAVAVASELGKLSLSLRSLGTTEDEQLEQERGRGHTWDTEVSAIVGAELKGGHEVEVVHGGKSETIVIGDGGGSRGNGGGGQGAQQGEPQ